METKSEPKIFDYNEPHKYLSDVLEYKRVEHRNHSINTWSKKMGFKHPSSLQFLINGKRKIRPTHIRKIFKGLTLSGNEEAYFEEMVYLNISTTNEERQQHEKNLLRMSEYNSINFMERESFEVVSDWYHFAICTLIMRGDFKNEPSWIAKQLNHRISKLDVVRAINRLKRVELIEEKDGVLKLTSGNRVFFNTQAWKSKAVAENNLQSLQLAKEVIQSRQDASTLSTYMTINSSKITEARKIIQDFKKKMAEVMEEEGGDATYQLGLQFFDISK